MTSRRLESHNVGIGDLWSLRVPNKTVVPVRWVVETHDHAFAALADDVYLSAARNVERGEASVTGSHEALLVSCVNEVSRDFALPIDGLGGGTPDAPGTLIALMVPL